jgi:hypothetical protein
MRARSLPLIVATVLIAGPTAVASAVTHREEVGPEQGVQATVTGKTVQIRFTGAAAAFGQREKGKKVAVDCAKHPAPGLLFVDGSYSDTFKMAKLSADGASLTVTLRDDPGDACDIYDAQTSISPAARAALTPAGATWIDEEVRATRMIDVAHAARPVLAYRTAGDVVSIGGGEVVALDTPDATPPTGKIGYWAHGGAVSFVTLSSAGRRLWVQDLGGGMLHTDVLEAVVGWTPPKGFALPGEDQGPSAGAAPGSGSADAGSSDDSGPDLGPGDGVSGRVVAGDRVVIRFTGKAAKAYRAIAGHRVEVACLAAPPAVLLGSALAWRAPTITKVRVPRRGGAIRAAAKPGNRDVCVVGEGQRTIATVLLSKAGRRFVGDFAAFGTVLEGRLPDALAAVGATSYPGAATIAAAHKGLVPMASPGQKVAPGKVGVWTDGGQRALLAFTGSDGRRFVLADEGGGTVRTNVFTALMALLGSLA